MEDLSTMSADSGPAQTVLNLDNSFYDESRQAGNEEPRSVTEEFPSDEEAKSISSPSRLTERPRRQVKESGEHPDNQGIMEKVQGMMERVLGKFLERQSQSEDLIRRFLQEQEKKNEDLTTKLEVLQQTTDNTKTAGRIANPGEYSRFMASDRVHPDTISGYPWLRLSEPESKLPFGDSGHMRKNVEGYPSRLAGNQSCRSHSLDLNLEPKEAGLTEVIPQQIVQSLGGATHGSVALVPLVVAKFCLGDGLRSSWRNSTGTN